MEGKLRNWTCRVKKLPLVYRLQPLDKGQRILVACGPGNNGIFAGISMLRGHVYS